MRLFVMTLLICLGFSNPAWAKGAKAAKTGGHPTYPRTLIYSAVGVKGQPTVVLPKDALAGVTIDAPLLTLEKKKGAGAEGENVEVETTQLKESKVKLAPATTTD
jgi:hypothetical protein